jgi:hypothetical protein
MTKTKVFIAVATLLFATYSVSGQTEDNALNYSYNRPTGTARSMGLGGAMGALGGDYSAIGINPAGIAVYRSSEFSFTPSLIFNQTESDYDGTISTDDKFSLPINHISYVGTSGSMRDVTSGLVSTHFGIGYNRTNNYNRKSFIQADGINASLLDMFVYKAGNLPISNLDDFYLGTAFDAFLIDRIQDDLLPDQAAYEYLHGYEYLDEEFNTQFGPLQNGIKQMKIIENSGYSGQFDLTFGANISNKLHLGASLGIATLVNKKVSSHYEQANANNTAGSSYQNYLYYREMDEMLILDDFYFDEFERTTGTGINLNLGVIFKPFSSIRLGGSLRTPTYYSMDMEYDTKASAYYFDADKYEIASPLGEMSFNFRTPLKATGSFAYIIGTSGLISVDYEYTDYASMKYKSQNTNMNETSYFNRINDVITNTFTAPHKLRVVGEYRLSPMFSLRGGYAWFQSPYQKQYLNSEGDHYNITGGFGFRHGNMTIDLAYLYNNETYIHSLYQTGDDFLEAEFQKPANITSTDHQIAVTLGGRF